MTRLVSGKVLKTPSANVSADRYEFIEISEAEPDLGLPPANGYVFSSDTEGTRFWVQLSTDNVIEGSNLYYSNDRVFANIQLASVGDLRDVTTANIQPLQALVWDGNLFVPTFVSTDLGQVADLALRVLTLEQFTTANIAEASSNLYFTNSRVIDALVGSNVNLNNLNVSGDLTVQGNTVTLNVATLVVEDKNIVIANGAPDAATANGAGITIEGANATILYINSGDKFELNKNLDVQGNIVAGSGTGGSITGANLITTNYLDVDVITSNTINNSGYVNFGSQSYIGDEPGYADPALRIVAAAGLGLSFENDADISGNNNVATFSTSGEFAVPKSLQANSLVSNSLVITGPATVNGYNVLTSELTDATFEPMGHENKANSQISFDNNTRTFTIQPVGSSHTVWVKGNKFVKTGAESITLANTTDLYYIYYNTAGNLAVRSSYFDWENDALTSYVYWNANTQSAPFVADERHGITLDWATHEYLHKTRGAAIAEGFSIGNYVIGGDGSLDSHAQIDIGNGTFFDEDLQVSVTHSNSPTPDTWEQDLQGPARIPMFYLVGTEWVRDEPTNFPLKQGTARIKYNLLSGGQWTTPDVPSDGLFTTTWIIATNNLNYPILAIMGQSANDTIGEEEAINFQDLTLTDFPVIEFRPLYKIIWNTNTGYTNAPNAIISKVYDLRNIVSASPTAAIASDHGLLSGLGDDDHSQYVHTEVARTISADHTFTGDITFANISASGQLSGNLTGQVSDISNHSVNALSDVDITGITTGQILTWNGFTFIPGSANVAFFSEFANTAVFANTVGSLEGLNTDGLTEGSNNLYFTVDRARTAYTAGKGIIITQNGTISSSDDSDLYNIEVDNSVYYTVTDIMAPVISIGSEPTTDSYLVHSLQLTNVSDEIVYVSGNILYASGQSVDILNQIRMPVGSSLELFDKSLALTPGDSINLQGFDSNLNPTSNLISAVGTYETIFNDLTFRNPGKIIDNPDANVLIYNSNTSYFIIETIKVINLDNSTIPVKINVTDSNDIVRGHIVYNLQVPPNTIVDVLQKPKRLELTNKLYASYSGTANTNSIGILVSGRVGVIYGDTIIAPTEITSSSLSNNTVSFSTTASEGTTVYYSFREV